MIRVRYKDGIVDLGVYNDRRGVLAIDASDLTATYKVVCSGSHMSTSPDLRMAEFVEFIDSQDTMLKPRINNRFAISGFNLYSVRTIYKIEMKTIEEHVRTMARYLTYTIFIGGVPFGAGRRFVFLFNQE